MKDTSDNGRTRSWDGGAEDDRFAADRQALRQAGFEPPIEFKGLFLEEAEAVLTAIGEPRYRARQILEWIYLRDAADFAAMSNLPASLRARLAAVGRILRLGPAATSASGRDETVKFLFRLADGEAVESVLMRYRQWSTACLSTQVGCRMGCAFCASTIGGLVRQLSAGEILDQVLRLRAETGETVGRVVIMGTGEPLDNYEATVRFIRLIHQPYSLGLGYRHITVSTSGLVPGIERLAAEGLPVTLAVSLHAPRDELRRQIMPVARRWGLADLIGAADRYAEVTGRRVTYEYTLIGGLNDGPREADELARLLAGHLAHVNLIPLNPVPERGFSRPGQAVVQAFLGRLERAGISATIRRELGSDINAACGQLRRDRGGGRRKAGIDGADGREDRHRAGPQGQ
ncbi:MAG TPA: 23S rRNA (adenine(2503)-C(2))-methyltransferase RlmN [Bacillota bacterium]|jgi:23S rRNA (adenine2503-C2)-methyltransferase